MQTTRSKVRRDVAAVARAVAHDDPPGITIDIAGLGTVIEFAARLETIKREFEAGRVLTADDYHRRVQDARTYWEMHK